MIQRGTFQCAICEKRFHDSKKNEEPRSYFPERKILVCNYCLKDFRRKPEYEHLRPDVKASEKQKIKKAREYARDTHIYL